AASCQQTHRRARDEARARRLPATIEESMEMTKESERCRRATGRAAAERYVEVDANPDDRARLAALSEWLERSTHHEAALERCEAAVMIARELAARGALDEACRASPAAPSGRGSERTRPRPHPGERASRAFGVRPSLRGWAARPAVAWCVAAIAVIWAVAATVERNGPPAV